MKKSHKILLGVGVGLGLAYLWNKKRKKAIKPSDKSVKSDETIKIEENPKSKEEKILYILENTDANVVENSTGFDGVKFVWNPKLGKFYPQGTITEEAMPQYADSVFMGIDGDLANDPTDDVFARFNDLNDKEINLAFNLVKYRKNNPSAISEEDAFKEIAGTDKDEALYLVKNKIKPMLNDIKALKKHPLWSNKWNNKKKNLKSKVIKVCGIRPADSDLEGMKKYHVCFERLILDEKKSKGKNEAPKTFQEKTEFVDKRQNNFAKEVVSRNNSGMFAGKRWDGRNNRVEESRVRTGNI